MNKMIGATWKNLTPKHLESMTARDLRAVAKSMRDAANKRITALSKFEAFEDLPAYVATKSGRHFEAPPRNATRDEIVNHITEVHIFLNAPTSTLRGAKAWVADIAEKENVPFADFRELMKEIRRRHSRLFSDYGSDSVYAEAINSINSGETIVELKRRLEILYEEEQYASRDEFSDLEWF